jgi:hypothetical protein
MPLGLTVITIWHLLKSFEKFSGNFWAKIDVRFLHLISVLSKLYTYNSMYDHKEDLIAAALSWTLAGILFSIFVLIKLGASNSSNVSSIIERGSNGEFSTDDHRDD